MNLQLLTIVRIEIHLTNQNKYDMLSYERCLKMNLQEMENRFDTENKCLNYLFKLRWKCGFRCPRCQCMEMWEIRSYKYKCKNCGYQTTVISGTLFQDTHIPLVLWFRAMWYVSQNNQISAASLQKDLGLGSNRTALTLLNKINRARIRFVLEKLQGTVEIYRTMIRPYKKSVSIAVAVEIENKQIGRIRISALSPEKLNLFVENCIQPQSIIIGANWIGSDKLMKSGYKYNRRTAAYEFPFAKKICSKVEKWLRTLQPTDDISKYLDQYCMMFNSLKTKISFDELLDNAIHLQPNPYADSLFRSGLLK